MALIVGSHKTQTTQEQAALWQELKVLWQRRTSEVAFDATAFQAFVTANINS
jgi:hypothetical protein